MNFRTAIAASIVCLALVAATAAIADTIELNPSKDNTLIEENGAFSNGAGQRFFAGLIAQGPARRAVLAFDLSDIPEDSEIKEVTLTLEMTMTIVGPFEHTLHRLLSDWGEGTSVGTMGEGIGAPATAGDATWTNTFFPTDFWGTPGGDFVGSPSASQVVDQFDFYTWGSTPELVADVQGWVDDPSSNFGWILIGDETTIPSAKAFNSKDNSEPGGRPLLTVTFNPPDDVPAVSMPGLLLLVILMLVAGTFAARSGIRRARSL